jgi:hypothetical protein
MVCSGFGFRLSYFRGYLLTISSQEISAHTSWSIGFGFICEKYVDNNEIDASLGLAFSLELFKRYKRSGVLYAEVRRVLNLRGKGTAYLQLANGVTISSYIEDLNGQRYPLSENDLIRIDRDKGPFAWCLKVAPAKSSPQNTLVPEASPIVQRVEPLVPFLSDTAVLVIIVPIEWERLTKWTPEQRRTLYTVWRMIDGRRDIGAIKAMASTSIPASTVDEALQVLLKLNSVVISSS